MSQLKFKTRLFTVIVVFTNVVGNTALTYGMKKMGVLDSSPLSYIKAILSPWVLVGIAMLILWMLSRMTLLSWADLSYVLPVTSAGYILQALIGRFVFAEQISPWRWSGTILIVAGIVLVGVTSPSTTRRETVASKAEKAIA